MATIVSELIARLKDGISGPAAKAGRSLDTLVGKANQSGGGPYGGKFMSGLTASTREAAGALIGFGGVAGGALLAKQSLTEYAAFDRTMSRIGITAEATSAQVADAKRQIFTIANTVGLSVDEVRQGLDSLTASGRDMPTALAFLPAVATAAQASGAAVEDMAASADALGANLHVAAPQMQEAFDILDAAGKKGKFELKDMAAFLPSLAAAANSIGITGVDGTRKLAAMLQIIRKQTGTAGEAATNMQNIFQKMTSQETQKKFAKMGVKDLRGELDKARKSGKDVIETLLDLTDKATKGDMSKLPLLFNDMQMQAGMRALMSQRDALHALENDLRNVAGTTAKDLAKVANDPEAAFTRAANSWEAFKLAIGRGLDASGAISALSGVTDALNSTSDALENLTTRTQEKGPIGGLFQTIVDQREKARNTPSHAVTPFGSTLWEQENSRLLTLAKQKVEVDADYVSAQVRQNKERQRYEDIAKRGTVTPATQERFQRAVRETDAAMAARRRQIEADRADALQKLTTRGQQDFDLQHPGNVQPRTKDDTNYSFFGKDGRPVLGPSLPPRAAPGPAALPAPAPTEIRPKVNSGQIDQAAQLLQGLDQGIRDLNGLEAVVNVKPGGNTAALKQDLREIKSLMDEINSGFIRAPSGGPGRAGSHGSGSYADTGVGH